MILQIAAIGALLVALVGILVAFLAGHIAYVVAFLERGTDDSLWSFAAAATAAANVGPGIGDVIGPVQNFAALSDPSKWIICAVMILGRLEIFTALILLTPEFWRS